MFQHECYAFFLYYHHSGGLLLEDFGHSQPLDEYAQLILLFVYFDIFYAFCAAREINYLLLYFLEQKLEFIPGYIFQLDGKI